MSDVVVPVKTYLFIWLVLLLLVALTVGAAFVHLGRLNPAVAVTIAVVKAGLIALYFMHVRYSPRLIAVVICGSLLWLGIMFMYSFGDYMTRGYLAAPTIWR
jgi:cytochrome c oxidase subunit IV